jgi:hypothetical protein
VTLIENVNCDRTVIRQARNLEEHRGLRNAHQVIDLEGQAADRVRVNALLSGSM